jgi:class 3 adenylate cyclase
MEKKETVVNKILAALFPTLLIPSTSLLKKWQVRNNSTYRKPAAIFLLFFSFVYIAHFHFIDIPAHKEPLELYFKYRYGLASLALITGLASFFKFTENPILLRLPLIISCLNFGYWQAKSMTWRPDIPYLYSVLFPLFTGFFLKLSPVTTLIFILIAYALNLDSWNHDPAQMRFIVSACVAGTMTLLAIRSRMQSDVHFFLLEEENLKNQKRLIEVQTELNEQIKTFLPSELFRRFNESTRTQRLSPLEAVDEILRPKEKFITVLATDIRGYTSAVKNDLKNYALNSFIPQQKHYTDVIDKHRGISRVVGDQIFAYFDQDNPVETVIAAVRSACAILQTTSNEGFGSYRPIIISSGRGITGNVGGTSSARVISVIGNVANLPSRIDPLTKEIFLKNSLSNRSLILTKSSFEIIRASFPKLKFTEITIPTGQSIRDFPEETDIFLLEASASTHIIVGGLYDQIAARKSVEFYIQSVSAVDRDSTTVESQKELQVKSVA